MKNIILILTLLTGLVGCGYQEKILIQGGGGIPRAINAITDAELSDVSLDPLKTEADYLDQYLAQIVVEFKDSQGNDDSVVDYKKLERLIVSNDPAVKALRLRLFKFFRDTNTDNMDTERKLAFLINAYNFFCIETVVAYYNGGALNSILDIEPTLQKPGASAPAFGTLTHRLANQKVTLDTIENGIIRPMVDYADARIHFALICASKGCPVLRKIAYRGETIQQQLDDTTRIGMKLPRIYSIQGGKVILSQIFTWFSADFENQEETIENFVRKYATEVPAEFPQDISYVTYDWSLNEKL